MNLNHPIAKGNTANIYLSNHKIVKVFNDFLPNTESQKEANKQRYAYSCGLPVPEIYEVTTIKGKQAIVMEHVKGETLGDLFLKNKEQAAHYMNLSIEMQLNIHRIIPDNIEPMYDKLHGQIQAAPILNPIQKSQLLKLLESITYTNRLCHGDFHLFNLILADTNQVFVIDWVDASAGDIRADIYRTYLLYSQLSSELAEMYVQMYCEKSGLLRAEICQWAPIIAGARLAENVESENSQRLIRIVDNYLSQ
ncbi:phosphotransferase family protein [Radiobacillus deserti]|uniref:Aminoglycoside phosphotransferase family protein n=1 Tax=Radiobacillus deserti TaxID=2594883 RepID=A0A516KDR5_9BACI|nr:aminoglycoside phosphotransferase family protein [Radiobacillus deserti]QDP39520.1 aminoglycoside phosphotransferase family protein [Radiobacillus deserti]